MTLNNFLSALKTPDVKIILLDASGTEIIKFFSSGYAGVESDILARTVRKFEITSVSSISITVNDAVTTPATEPSTDGTNDGTSGG